MKTLYRVEFRHIDDSRDDWSVLPGCEALDLKNAKQTVKVNREKTKHLPRTSDECFLFRIVSTLGVIEENFSKLIEEPKK